MIAKDTMKDVDANKAICHLTWKWTGAFPSTRAARKEKSGPDDYESHGMTHYSKPSSHTWY